MSTDGSPRPVTADAALPGASATTPATPAGPLPADLATCHALILELIERLRKVEGQNSRLEHQLQQLLRRLYGRSAERIDPNQQVLFAEVLGQLQGASPEPATPPAPPIPPAAPPRVPGNGHGRRRLPADLPRRRVIHDLAESEKPCPCCQKVRLVIGEEVSEQLEYEPAKLTVIEHVRRKYGCPDCEAQARDPQITAAEKPLAPIEKGLAAPGLLSYVIVSKYGDHLPLYRLEHILGRHGVQIARSTTCDWMAYCAQALRPLYKLMVQDVLGSRIIHTDDTPVDVLDPALRHTRTGRFWVYLDGPDHRHIVFEYTPSRSRDGPMRFLAGWGKDRRVYLQADAFGGYDGIYAGKAGGSVTEVACLAHARRKFYDARTSDVAASLQALAYIRLLYDVEDRAAQVFQQQGQGPGARPLSAIRLTLRQEQAAPTLEKFGAWLRAQQASQGGPVLPKSPMGEATAYALNQWEALTVYTRDGELAIDNNAAENALRRICLGRKNWLFAGSDNGGATAAVLFSFMATCQRHAVEPWAYLRDVLTRIAATPISQLGQLLPDRWKTTHAASAPAGSPATGRD